MLKSKLRILNDVLILRLDGEFDQHYTKDLRENVTELLTKYNLHVLAIDMCKCTFIDSSAIGFIIGRYNYLRGIKGKIILYNLNPIIEKIIMLSGIYKICEISKETIHFEEIGVYNEQIQR